MSACRTHVVMPCMRRVLAEAAGVGWAEVQWSHRHPAQLDLLPVLRHGRALGLRGRVAPLLGLRKPGAPLIHEPLVTVPPLSGTATALPHKQA